MLTKFICSSKIYFNQSINYLSTKEKKEELNEQKKPKTFIEYYKTIDNVYENLEEYNPTK